jgi:prevent-host-death family protein
MGSIMVEWQLQQARVRLRELLQHASDEGPQVITLHRKRAAVVLSAAAYDRLAGHRPSLADFLLSGPRSPDDVLETINYRQRDAG